MVLERSLTLAREIESAEAVTWVASALAEVHRYDEAVLERAVGLAEPTDPLHHEAVARLQLAQDG